MIRNLFYIGIIVAASGLIGPPAALAAGLVFGLTGVHPFPAESRGLSKFLLQAAVVCLGFGMNLREVVHAGRSGFLYTAISITFVLSLGDFLAPLLLGGPSGIMISNIVVSLFGAAYNWPLGAAISLCMLVLVASLLFLSERLEKRWSFS